jgi:hypothetical protein
VTGNQTREHTNPTGYHPPERLRSYRSTMHASVGDDRGRARDCSLCGTPRFTAAPTRLSSVIHRLPLRCCASALLFFQWRIGFIRRRLDFGALGFAQRSFLVSPSLFFLAPSTCRPRSLGSISSVIWLKCHRVPRWLITHLLALYNHVAMPSLRHVRAPNS